MRHQWSMALIYGATPRKIQKSWKPGKDGGTSSNNNSFGYFWIFFGGLCDPLTGMSQDPISLGFLRIITSVSHGVTDGFYEKRRLLPRWIVLVHTGVTASVLTAQKHALDSRRTIWSFLTTTESVHCQVWLSPRQLAICWSIHHVSLSLPPFLSLHLCITYNLKSWGTFNLICFSRLIFRMFFSGGKTHFGVPSTSASIPCKVGFAVSWLIKSKNTRPGKQTLCNWSHGPVEIVSFPSFIAW